MDVELPPQLEDFLRAQVRTGRYADEQDVVRDALRHMRELVRAAEDPNVVGLVRDAANIATQAQRDVLSLLQTAEGETNVFSEVLGHAGNMATVALDVVRRVPGAREVDRILRGPIEQVTAAAQRGESQARLMRTNLETTARALGLLAAVLERVNTATRTLTQPTSRG